MAEAGILKLVRWVGGSSGTWGLGLWTGHLKSLPTWSGTYVHCSHKAKPTGVGAGRVKDMPPYSQCAIRQVTKTPLSLVS